MAWTETKPTHAGAATLWTNDEDAPRLWVMPMTFEDNRLSDEAEIRRANRRVQPVPITPARRVYILNIDSQVFRLETRIERLTPGRKPETRANFDVRLESGEWIKACVKRTLMTNGRRVRVEVDAYAPVRLQPVQAS